MSMFLRHTFPSKKRCEKCGKATKSLYELRLDDYSIQVCSGMCLKEAQANWQQKKDLNIKPGQPLIEEDIEEMEADNI